MNADGGGTDTHHAELPAGEGANLRARTLATKAHRGQFDKADRPYVEHPERVVGYLVNPTADEVVVAWMHDVVEDTAVTLQQVEEEFGPTVAAAVNAITRRPEEAGSDYYARVKANPIALTVKCADLADNRPCPPRSAGPETAFAFRGQVRPPRVGDPLNLTPSPSTGERGTVAPGRAQHPRPCKAKAHLSRRCPLHRRRSTIPG